MSDAAEERAREVSVSFGLALSRMQARIKKESGRSYEGITPSQVAMMQRLETAGQMSVTELAAAEHVSQQAITQRLALLAPTGFVETHKDAHDARKKAVGITQRGEQALREMSEAGSGWLTREIAAHASPADLDALERATEIMERLASSDQR